MEHRARAKAPWNRDRSSAPASTGCRARRRSTAHARWSPSSCGPTSRCRSATSPTRRARRSTTSRLLAPSSRTSCSSATPPARSSPARCSRCTPPATTRGRRWPGSPGPTSSGSPTSPARPPTSASPAATVRHVAQVDSLYLLGTRDWTDTDVPAHTRALGKVLLAPARSAAPRAARPPDRRTRSTALSCWSTGAVRRPGSPPGRRARGRAHRCRRAGHGAADEVVAALGVSGPTARLADQVDEMGRLLVEQADLCPCCCVGEHKEGAA